MTKQTINLGSSVNKGDGDPLRTAFTKINQNFDELYTTLGVTSLTELAQDYAAQMFLNGTHEGITVTYDDSANKFNLTVEQDLDGGSASAVFDDDTTINGGGA